MRANKNPAMLTFVNTATTQLNTLDKYDYDRLRENTAKLKAIENLAIEDEVVNGAATTQLITLDKYDYDRLRENTAKLKAIENLAIEDEVVNGDVI